MKIERTDPFTGEHNVMEIDITEEQYVAWRSGHMIQNVMPHLTPDEREFIMTGIMPDSWDKYTGSEK